MTPPYISEISSPEDVGRRLQEVGYISSAEIAMTVFLAVRLQKPVLIEGPAGVGKTNLAQSLAQSLSLPLLRLQCYEGLDEAKAIYEWKYGKQLLYTQILREKIREIVSDSADLEASLRGLARFDDLFFSRPFLEPRALMKAMEAPAGSVLLVDEIDKSEEEFEALLLEVLSDYQVTVPEIGTISAVTPPLVLLTSNNTRELGDALRRRCLHLFIGFPDSGRERAIVRSRAPGVSEKLLAQLVAFVQLVRGQGLRKPPSVSETVDWARTLMLLNAEVLDPALVRETLNVILKRQGDIDEVTAITEKLTRDAITSADVG
jgi:MoxR-like ATPase